MFLALSLTEGDRSRGVIGSILVLAMSCLLYLALRIGFTSGYQHQIDPAHVAAQLRWLNFPDRFFVGLILAQALPLLLLVLIATKAARLAAYLLISAVVMAVTALATEVTDVGLLLGETLPFYATIFILTWNGALPARDKATCLARPASRRAAGCRTCPMTDAERFDARRPKKLRGRNRPRTVV
jgi:hypothetical protein